MRKLTEHEFYELQSQYERTPGPGDTYEATGEHYFLVNLLRKLGFIEPDKWKALKLAERLLNNGYA